MYLTTNLIQCKAATNPSIAAKAIEREVLPIAFESDNPAEAIRYCTNPLFGMGIDTVVRYSMNDGPYSVDCIDCVESIEHHIDGLWIIPDAVTCSKW